MKVVKEYKFCDTMESLLLQHFALSNIESLKSEVLG